MSTTEESSNDNPLEETEAQRSLRHAEQRLDDWQANGGMCGVTRGFMNASLHQYDRDLTALWRKALKEGKWIFTHGQVGTGKTHLLSAITRSRYIWGWSCWFAYVPAFLARLKRSYDAGKEDETSGDLLGRAMSVDLLVLDDLGVEKLTSWSSETLTLVLNDRYATKRATVISSNFDVAGLVDRYERIADRIRERAVQVPLEEKRPERT